MNDTYVKLKNIPTYIFLLYYKNIKDIWTINPRVFFTKDEAEYVGNLYDRETYILSSVVCKNEKLKKRSMKIVTSKKRGIKIRMPRKS